MQIFLVGGCVRDELLGRKPKDIDYVVINSSPEEMIALGYEQVGAAFPVFLKDGCEYALARRERKTGVGYGGFETETEAVTLEEDLARRDLTINSMARDIITGEIIDPYNGQRDLEFGVLRHTSEAFAEDPLRVLRVARFAARYKHFRVAAPTIRLMIQVAPELKHIATERIWAEIEKGLSEERPFRMFEVLAQVGAFDHHPALLMYKNFSKSLDGYNVASSFESRFLYATIESPSSLLEDQCIPAKLIQLHQMATKWRTHINCFSILSPEDMVTLMQQTRALTDMTALVTCLNVIHRLQHKNDDLLKAHDRLIKVWEQMKSVSMTDVAQVAKETGQDVKKLVYDRYVEAIR